MDFCPVFLPKGAIELKMERGFRGKIEDYANISQPIQVRISTVGNAVYDTCCFGVDAQDKLSDDRYMIFYNQPASPAREIEYSQNNDTYTLRLESLPQNVQKLVFTVSIDGNGTMGDIQNHSINIMQNGNSILELSLSGKDFSTEKAIIGIEIYRKGVWRVSVVARGFNGGLDALLKSYGGEIAGESAPQNNPPVNNEEQFRNKIMGRISLSKDKVNLEKHVVSLSKCVVDLSKKSGVDLGNTRAKVVVALDFSGSMSSLYRNGTVQKTINKLVPLGLTFDDNGAIDMFLFHDSFIKLDDLDLSNYENYVNYIKKSGYEMGGTNYAPVLCAIIEGYEQPTGGFFGRTKKISPIVDNGDPTFILFITDGANADRGATNRIIKKCSDMNVFIQFIGIGNYSFDYLEKLDDMKGRARDNTGFSKMSSLENVSDSELYTDVLEQFSKWLKGLQ